MPKKLNQTNKNTPINRGNISEMELFLLARPIWQGWQESNQRPLVLETNALAS